MESVFVNIKVVPGSSRDRVSGLYADGIKIQTSAPPEAGKANRAVVRILARFLGVKPGQVELVSSPSNPRKCFKITDVSPAHLAARLATLA